MPVPEPRKTGTRRTLRPPAAAHGPGPTGTTRRPRTTAPSPPPPSAAAAPEDAQGLDRGPFLVATGAAIFLVLAVLIFIVKSGARPGPSPEEDTAAKKDAAPAIDPAAQRREQARALLDAAGPIAASATTALFAERKAACTRALEADPTFAPAWLERARTGIRAGEYLGAASDLSEAIYRDPRLAEAYELRARLALDLLDDPAAAARDYKRVVELDAAGPRGRFADLMVPFAQGDLLDAVDRLGEFLKKNEGHCEAHLRRGQGLLRFGNAADAAAECEKAIGNDGNELRNLIAYSTRAEARAAQKDGADGAALDVESALKINPRFGPALLVRARLRATAGKEDEALADFAAAAATGLRGPAVLLERSRFHAARGRLEEALADGHAALQLDPHAPETCAELGFLYLKRCDMVRAIEHLARAEKLAPKGAPYLDAVKKRLAVAKKRRGIEAIPITEGKEFQARGDEYINLKEYEFAEYDYRKALELDATLHGAWYNLACIYSIWNRMDQAVEHLRKAFETGFKDFEWAGKDDDLVNLRKDPRYQELVDEAKKKKS